MAPKKNGGGIVLGVVCAALGMMFGDYLYPQGGQELGRVFGAVKGGIGFALGAGLWLLGRRVYYACLGRASSEKHELNQ